MSSNTFYALLSVAIVVLVGFLMLSFSTAHRNQDSVTDLRVIDLTPQVPARNTTNIDVSPTVTTPSTPAGNDFSNNQNDEVDEVADSDQ